ncbi:MAG: D-alanyl-D-alanine carboxypeptidase/D-alanyl-D-alanine-endopeptidase [Deltaproteobacteria bacterium]|nr:D-alanyl-D-alanine carboxypeptidase/D-alanyl-D-alanine-endopeptidase [Deltaproteobacteria bacterium]
MIRFTKATLAIFLLLLSHGNLLANTSTSSQAKSVNKKLSAEFDRIISMAENRGMSVGFNLVDVETGDTIYSYNGDKMLIPASTMKLITTAVALSHFGPEHRFSTKFFSAVGVDEFGVINSDLHIVGEGDPLILEDDLQNIVEKLYSRGVRRINGNIVIDDSFFSEGKNIAGWTRKSLFSCSEPFISATSVGFNLLYLEVKPPFIVDKQPLVEVFPCNQYYRIINNLSVSEIKKTDIVIGVANGTILVDGMVNRRKNNTFYTCINIPNTAHMAGTIFARFAEQQGISVAGSVLEGSMDKGHTVLILDWKGNFLREIIKPLNKQSNNFIAEQIFQATGAKTSGKQATWESSRNAAEEFIKTKLKRNTGYKIINGSGLSRENLLSAQILTDLLRYMWKDSKNREYFIESLPVMGIDGTLKQHNKNSRFNENILAKTGSLDNVNSLAGYLTTDAGKVMAFAMIINTHRNVGTRSLIDKILIRALKIDS